MLNLSMTLNGITRTEKLVMRDWNGEMGTNDLFIKVAR